LGQVAAQYLGRLPTSQRDLAASEINRFVRHVGADRPVTQITKLEVERYQQYLADTAGGGGGNGSVVVELRSVNFSSATDCPLTTLAGKSLAIFWNDIPRFLDKDAGDWSDLPGGGFKINISGFDATTNNYLLYAFVL